MNKTHPVRQCFLILFALLGTLCLTVVDSAFSAESSNVVGVGKKVSIEYTVSREDKTKVESNVGKDPLTYTHGGGNILPGLEAGLVGLKEGDEKTITLKPEEAYGQVNPKAVVEVKKELVPENLREVGKQLVGRGPHGKMQRFKVKEVKDNTIVLDFNHPLAGQTLVFLVKVLKVE
jgi:FKBP-type peptidyl-prolyl cis-trans isomerase 2